MHEPDDLMEGMLGKEPIRPVVVRLTSLIEELGPDVATESRRTHVAFSRGQLSRSRTRTRSTPS